MGILIRFFLLTILGSLSAQAMNDRPFNEFTGDTLVIGSMKKNDPNKYTVDINGGDMKRDCFDFRVVRDFPFPEGRFHKIIFENVGTTLSCLNWGEQCPGGSRLPGAYKKLLKPGGELRFQSFRYILENNQYNNITGYNIAYLITNDPVKINENGLLVFINSNPSYWRQVFESQGKLEPILSDCNPLTQICNELHKVGFVNIIATTNPENDTGGLLVTANKQ